MTVYVLLFSIATDVETLELGKVSPEGLNGHHNCWRVKTSNVACIWTSTYYL